MLAVPAGVIVLLTAPAFAAVTKAPVFIAGRGSVLGGGVLNIPVTGCGNAIVLLRFTGAGCPGGAGMFTPPAGTWFVRPTGGWVRPPTHGG